MTEMFEVATADCQINRSFGVDECGSEDEAWAAAVKYACELIDRGGLPEDISIIEFEGGSPIEIRSQLEWFVGSLRAS